MRVECNFGNKRPIIINLEVDKENGAECGGCELHKNGGKAFVINQEVIWCEKNKVEKQVEKLDLFYAGHDRSYFASEPE
jgi:hypothetical protein